MSHVSSTGLGCRIMLRECVGQSLYKHVFLSPAPGDPFRKYEVGSNTVFLKLSGVGPGKGSLFYTGMRVYHH